MRYTTLVQRYRSCRSLFSCASCRRRRGLQKDRHFPYIKFTIAFLVTRGKRTTLGTDGSSQSVPSQVPNRGNTWPNRAMQTGTQRGLMYKTGKRICNKYMSVGGLWQRGCVSTHSHEKARGAAKPGKARDGTGRREGAKARECAR